ncbi:MAG: hypothetical protein AABZ24_12525 [Nitrospirota bacterium]
MERRAASHTEEEEMNQRRKLLNAARRGDTKAISKLFELYQVRVLSGDQLVKVNRTSAYMTPVKHSQSSKSKASEKKDKSSASKAVKKSGEASKPVATKAPTSPIKKSTKRISKHK